MTTCYEHTNLGILRGCYISCHEVVMKRFTPYDENVLADTL